MDKIRVYPTFLKAIIYGPSGHGKTTFLASGLGDDRADPMLILDFEGGGSSIASKLRHISIDEVGRIEPIDGYIDVVRISLWSDFETILEQLEEENPYQTIGLDSLTEVNILSVGACVDVGIELKRSHDPEIPELQDYLRNSVRMRTLVRLFRDLSCNVIFTALSTVENGQTFPMLSGKFSSEILGLVRTVGYLDVVEAENGGVDRVLIVSPTRYFSAKDSSEGGKLGEFIEQPTITKILDLLEVPHA